MKEVVNPRFNVNRNFAFDPTRDLQEVDQFGFVNLADCYEKGIIPSLIPESEEAFNGCINPGTLISRCSDVFDGLRKSDYVKNMLSKLTAEQREKAEKALAAQAKVSQSAGVSSEGQS